MKSQVWPIETPFTDFVGRKLESAFEKSISSVMRKRDGQWRAFVDALDEAGFFDRISTALSDKYKWDDLERPELLRFAELDGEELSERGMEAAIEECAPVLVERGIIFDFEQKAAIGPDTGALDYFIRVNGDWYRAWSFGLEPDKGWYGATIRVVEIMNMAFVRQGCAEQFYFSYLENQVPMLLMTQEQLAVFERFDFLIKDE